MSEMNQTSEPGASPAPTYPSSDGRLFVRLSLLVVAVMFISMVALLYWRERPAPSSLLVLSVPGEFDGAVATVDVDDGRDLRPIRKALEGDKPVRISLPPGKYLVKIEYKGKVVAAQPMQMADYSYYPFVLIKSSTTQPKANL